MIDNQYVTGENNYQLDDNSYDKYGLDNRPYFKINGHNFNVSTNASSKSEINLVKNKMYVPGKSWGYTDIQWTNFTGATITCEIYSRVTDKYLGKHAQPDQGGIEDFYTRSNGEITPHGVLKYWAETFVTCEIDTNLHVFESGKYKIDELSQSQPDTYFVVSKVTFIQYEQPDEIEQTYNTTAAINTENTSHMNAQAAELADMSLHYQSCKCNSHTDSSQCTASPSSAVKTIQDYLQQWGYFPSYVYGLGSIQPNGKFCYHTTQALKKFQEATGIETTGKFDEETKKQFLKKLEAI